MSWCRWGSVCTNTIVDPEIQKLNEACVDCPGSDLYIYEGDLLICCCGEDAGKDFRCATELEMYRHILEHDAKGDHVRKSLLASAREAVAGEGEEAAE